MVNRLLLALLLVLQALVINARAATTETGIKLISSDEAIYLGDSLVIEVEAVGMGDSVDFSPLFKHADLLRETTGTRIAVVEGQVVEVKLRRMELLPRREGDIIFGPVIGSSISGPASSNTVSITVKPPADINWQPDTDDLQVELTLQTDTQDSARVPVMLITADSSGSTDNQSLVYIGQHLIADIRLKHRHPIADERIVLPDFNGFDILGEHEERRTLEGSTAADSWRVTSWRYHLFAQRSGRIDITGMQWTGTTIRLRTQRASFTRIVPDTLIDIQPATDESSWWLPATDISLADSWSKDPRELKAGDEITRTITIDAQNVRASQLPVIEPLDSRGLSTTLIRQSRTEQILNSNVVAQANFEFRLVAQSPVPVFLDTVRVPWYNTRDKISKEAIIPARRINVGLPDRADLLADIATRDSWLEKKLLYLQGGAARFIPWHYTLVFLILAILVICLRELIDALKSKRLARSGKAEAHLPSL